MAEVVKQVSQDSDPELDAGPDFTLEGRCSCRLQWGPEHGLVIDKPDLSLGLSGSPIQCRVRVENGDLVVHALCADAALGGRFVRLVLSNDGAEPIIDRLQLTADGGRRGQVTLGALTEIRAHLGDDVRLELFPPRTVEWWLWDMLESADAKEADEGLRRLTAAALRLLPEQLRQTSKPEYWCLVEKAIEATLTFVWDWARKKRQKLPRDPDPHRWLLEQARQKLEDAIERSTVPPPPPPLPPIPPRPEEEGENTEGAGHREPEPVQEPNVVSDRKESSQKV